MRFTIHDVCGQPVVWTTEWIYYEFYCLECNTHHEYFAEELSDVEEELVDDQHELEAKARDLRLRYNQQRKARRYGIG